MTKSQGCMARLVTLCLNGSNVFGWKPVKAFPKKSPPFVAGWRYTDVIANPVHAVKRKSRESGTQRTRPTTVQGVRPAANYWPIARCPACSAKIGRKLLKNLVD